MLLKCRICGNNFEKFRNTVTCGKQCSIKNTRISHRKCTKAWEKRNPRNNQEYYALNKDKINKSNEKWRLANQDKMNAKEARRRAAKLNATPNWLTKEHFKEIECFYTEAKKLETMDGIKRHVDHIYPLQGENSCGLHVPWNLQILTETDNIKKSNKIE